MNVPAYFTLSFMIKKGQQKRSGEVPIFARLTISGQRIEFNINCSVELENRNGSKGVVKGVVSPVISNQRANSYLVEIAALAKIKKHMTTHNTPFERNQRLRHDEINSFPLLETAEMAKQDVEFSLDQVSYRL